jgi:hypothetical protein
LEPDCEGCLAEQTLPPVLVGDQPNLIFLPRGQGDVDEINFHLFFAAKLFNVRVSEVYEVFEIPLRPIPDSLQKSLFHFLLLSIVRTPFQNSL